MKASVPSQPTPVAGDRLSERIARFTIFLYAAGALIAGFAWVLLPLRGHRGFTWWETTFGLFNIPVTHTFVSAVLMFLTAWTLVRRKRAGLYAVMVFQIFGVILGISTVTSIFALDIPTELFTEPSRRNPLTEVFSLIFGIVALFFLWRARASFPAKTYRVAWLRASLVFLTGSLIATVFVWFTARAHHLDAGHLILHMVGLNPAPLSDAERHISWAPHLGSTILGITLVIAALFALRSPASGNDEHAWTGEHELKIRSLIQDYGSQDSLSYFATRREKSSVFSTDGQAAITYRVINSVCLASGDPVGARASWADAIEQWKHHARSYGWVLAAMSVSEDGAAAYAQAGLSVLEMGDEAILHTDRFSLNNTSLTEVRQAVNRVRKGGYTTSITYHQDLTDEQMKQLIEQADSWRHGTTERGFSMALGRLGDPADARNILVSAVDAQGKAVGLLSFVPWGRTGLSLDVMRRSPDAPNGIVEFMVAELMGSAADLGISRVSLNFAMFRGVFANAQRFGASPFTRLASSTLGVLDRFLQLERLYTFNQKFAPVWEPRYLCSDSAVSLAQVAVAAGIAEGFLPRWLTRYDKHPRALTNDQVAQVREIERRRVLADDIEPRWSDQTRHRIRHLNQLRAAGHNPYPLGLRVRYGVKELAGFLAAGGPDRELSVAGRVRSIRIHGGVAFVTLLEGTTTAQVICERNLLGADAFALLTASLDTADLVAFQGLLGTSRTGTPSLLASAWQMASKALQPVPFEGFTDPEARARRRSTDLLVNPDQVHNLKVRSATITSIRKTLDADGFTEVETPILNTVHGGASARPFKTFINAYGADLTLRIAPELYLKRLLVGGMGAVYELGRDFRNEGADATHNPEFTVLEAYKPYADYTTMRLLTEMLIKNAAYIVFGDEVLPLGAKTSSERVLTDVSGPWQVKTVLGALSEAVGREITLETDFEVLLQLAREHEIHVRDDMGPGAVIEELYSELVEAQTIAPTFYTDFPVETSPLAGPHRTQAGLVERWDLVINGMEIGTAYSEMTDALEQRRRLTEQSLKAAAGDLEAMQVDEDFLYALETGMPPAGGLGIGIDRLVMLLTQTQIRGVLAFPFVKPEK